MLLPLFRFHRHLKDEVNKNNRPCSVQSLSCFWTVTKIGHIFNKSTSRSAKSATAPISVRARGLNCMFLFILFNSFRGRHQALGSLRCATKKKRATQMSPVSTSRPLLKKKRPTLRQNQEKQKRQDSEDHVWTTQRCLGPEEPH